MNTCSKNVSVFVVLILLFFSSFCFSGPLPAEDEKPTTQLVAQDFTEIFSEEVNVNIFSFCDVWDVGKIASISKKWGDYSNHIEIWKSLSLPFKEEYPKESWEMKNYKKTVITHFLRVKINTLNIESKIQNCINKFPYILTDPYTVQNDIYIKILNTVLISTLQYPALDLWVARGNENAITRKIEGFINGWDGYDKNPDLIRPFITSFFKDKKTRFFRFFEAFGMKYGIFGFPMDEEKANKYINRYKISYPL